MGKNNYFQFKQFRISQEKAAMKVNTDGVLLGAWVGVNNVKSVLDIGTGTGIIALMVAQRCEGNITAIEIEENAATEAAENIKNSKWNHRISVQHISFQEFYNSTKDYYDLIVSNPPYFSNGVKNRCQNKSIARHNDLLPFSILIKGSVKLLKNDGKLAVILPVEEAVQFAEIAKKEGLHLERLTEIKPGKLKAVNRNLMEFSKTKSPVKTDSLTIYIDSGNGYTDEYKNLTREFYLNI